MLSRFFSFAFASLSLSYAATAYAQPKAEDIAAARSLGIQGVKLADEGKCTEALDKLERAEALYHAPTILGRIGECQVETGKIVEGTENLNRVVREQLSPGAPTAYKAAQERARKVLDKSLPRIAYLTIRIEPKTATPSVSISGAAVPNAFLGAERPTNPGTHQVMATAPGYTDASSTVTLAEGVHQDLVLTLVPVQATEPPPLPPAPAPVAPEPAPLPAAESHRSNTLAYVLLGVGGAGLLTGTITGIVAISKKNGLECPDHQCPPSQHDKLDSARTFSTISTIGFGVGLAGAAAGTVLLLVGKPEPEARVGSVRARPLIGDRWLGLTGEF